MEQESKKKSHSICKQICRILLIIGIISNILSSCSTSDPFTRKNLYRMACDSLQHDTVILVHKLTVQDDRLFGLFDSIIDVKNCCIYKNEEIWFNIGLSKRDSNRFYLFLMAYQHDERWPHGSILNLDIQGVVKYRNYPFIFSSIDKEDSSVWETQNLFGKDDTIDSLCVPFINKTLFTAYLENDFYHNMNTWYDFYYDGKNFIPADKNCHCIEYFPIFYHLKKKDDIFSVAKKFSVSPEMIMRLNNIQNPSKGSRKRIQVQ